MNKICGIYMIINDINDKIYIGQSKDIVMRWYAHRSKGKSTTSSMNSEYYSELHSDMRKFGVEQVEKAREMYKNGATPKEIQELLNLPGSIKTIREMLGERQYKNITKL